MLEMVGMLQEQQLTLLEASSPQCLSWLSSHRSSNSRAQQLRDREQQPRMLTKEAACRLTKVNPQKLGQLQLKLPPLHPQQLQLLSRGAKGCWWLSQPLVNPWKNLLSS
jgi:hypothetical protein